MKFDLNPLVGSPFFIGALGALVSLKFAPGANWFERCTNVGGGMLAAGFVSPALMEWLKFTGPGMVNASAFVIGMLGMSLIAAIFKGIRDLKIADAIDSWITRR